MNQGKPRRFRGASARFRLLSPWGLLNTLPPGRAPREGETIDWFDDLVRHRMEKTIRLA
jgi:hypothetical protein